MPRTPTRTPRTRTPARDRTSSEPDPSNPMVEIVLNGVDGDDWVTETLRSQGVAFRLLACRPADRGRRRLLRLFEFQTNGEGVAPVIRRLRSRLAARDVAAASLGTDRALVRVSVPMPALCAAAFDLGDFCISCPFLGADDGMGSVSWKVLVPQIVDARRLLKASAGRGGARPTLVRAGAYRRRWGLTGRQERALRLAFQLGYFDYPRKASLATLATRLGVGRSTALELLRKATTKLAAQRFLSEPPVDRPP
ncbi:MAG: helix-turn-helix domain-containing protein [Thermoplasmata archaeon]